MCVHFGVYQEGTDSIFGGFLEQHAFQIMLSDSLIACIFRDWERDGLGWALTGRIYPQLHWTNREWMDGWEKHFYFYLFIFMCFVIQEENLGVE
jgi:hypothetical protein